MIAVVLLAAGGARRFDGTQKLLATVPHEGAEVVLVRLTAEGLIEAGLDRIVVVLGRDAERVRRSLDGLDVRFVVNAAFASGMSSSLRAGVSEVMRLWPRVTWILIALGDQPMTAAGVVEELARVTAHSDNGRPASEIVAPRFRGEAGNPVLFASSLVPELMAISGDRGARAVVERVPARVRYVDFEFVAPPDVDTPDDLKRLRNGKDDS